MNCTLTKVESATTKILILYLHWKLKERNLRIAKLKVKEQLLLVSICSTVNSIKDLLFKLCKYAFKCPPL